MWNVKCTEDAYEDFGSDKEMLYFSNYSIKSKCYHNLNKLVIGKMKDETTGVAIKDVVGLKPKMHSCVVEDSSKLKKTNRNE